ncbi:hypothetical protein [Paenibacillus prosopidis]|uniref:Uncharacterized protein n=1 Tax=Paenibacillus prosopidis TaxID=630520 RepID=A0A368WBI3_9BACL|nr:hypothetical protein [Paenibacillus prosopidis]RCW51240.1 hypothetical protein DFP97_102436 [Paenibacillus prosopidis]
MFWTFIWFLINILFVVSMIAYLFMQRSYTETKRQSNDPELIARLDRRRKLVGGLSILFFLAMAASLMINMRLNG